MSGQYAPEERRDEGDYTEVARYVFTGAKRNGAGVAGSTLEHPSTFVARCFERRWQWLSMHRDGDEVNEVGGIRPHPDTGRRTWWAEA